MACTICDEAIADDQPSMTLLCLHKYHTLCFLQSKAASYISDARCPTCDIHIVPNDVLLAAEQFHSPDTKHEIIKFLWETDAMFKEHLVTLRTIKRENNRLGRIATKRQSEILKEYKELIKPHVETLKTIVIGTKKNFMKSEEYINAKKSMLKYSLAQQRLRKEWGISMWELQSALRKIPEAKPYLPEEAYSRHRFNRSLYKFNIRIK